MRPDHDEQAEQQSNPAIAREGLAGENLLIHQGDYRDPGVHQGCEWNERIQRGLTIQTVEGLYQNHMRRNDLTILDPLEELSQTASGQM